MEVSFEDINLIEKFLKGVKILVIFLFDYIIIGNGEYFSIC